MLVPGARPQPVDRLLRPRRRVEASPAQLESDLVYDHPVTTAELDAIEQLLGPALKVLLAD
jgi:hypothetical protein